MIYSNLTVFLVGVQLLHANFLFIHQTSIKLELSLSPLIGALLWSFFSDNNGRSCALNPFGCGNIVVLQHADGRVGIPLCLCGLVPNELACFVINPDGSDGCRIVFVAREYAGIENARWFAGALVHLVAVYLLEHENRMAQCLYHHNCRYTVGEVLEFANNSNK
jgi:hypothetical protein